MVALYKFMPISPRSDQIPPLATRQLLPPSWWRRRSTFSGFLLKQLSYLLLATFLFVPWCPPSTIAWTPYLPDVRTFPACNIEHACLCGNKIYDAGWNEAKKACQQGSEKSPNVDAFAQVLRARSLGARSLGRTGVAINCPLMPPVHT